MTVTVKTAQFRQSAQIAGAGANLRRSWPAAKLRRFGYLRRLEKTSRFSRPDHRMTDPNTFLDSAAQGASNGYQKLTRIGFFNFDGVSIDALRAYFVFLHIVPALVTNTTLQTKTRPL